MWRTPSYSLAVCLICLMKLGEIRAQCNAPYVGENRVIDGTSQANYPDGSTVTFKCEVGYQSAGGSKTITCTGTKWSELSLQCRKKNCGNPGDILNGKYITDGNLYGSTARPECNEGYNLVGTIRTCQDNGWDGRVATCEVVQCEPPPTITNGQFEPVEDNYNYNEVVTYSCSGSYDLVGASGLTCSSDGKFHPVPPSCTIIKCDAPVIANAVKIEGKSPPYRNQEFVRYKCNEGYTIVGPDYLTCGPNGWNPSIPFCNKAHCDTPVKGENRVIDGPSQPSYRDGSVVTFKCAAGYESVGGSKTITCTGTKWSELSLQCRIVPGPSPNPSPEPEPDRSSKTGLVVGLVLGGLGLASIVAGVIIWNKRSSWRKVPSRNEGCA